MKTPWWFLHKTPIAIVLLPVAWLYYLLGRVVFVVRKIGAIKSRRKIICIGNILAGGVGKTPIVRAIANYFDAPVVMRGYKKSMKSDDVGDEAKMLARDGLAVHVGNRKSNIILLNKQSDKTPIVMDDGLQNSSIKKDVSVLVFDEKIGMGNGLLLPAGPLREPWCAIKKADAVIIIKSDTKQKNKKIRMPESVPVFYAYNQTVSPFDGKQKVFAFAGIGYPKKFFAALNNVVGKRAFADHYQYTDDDLKKLIMLAERKKAKLITTEKDWVRLPDWAQKEVKFARLETVIDEQFFDWIKGK